MTQYHHLTEKERYHIDQCVKSGMKRNQIAAQVGVNKSTISRELSRNSGLRSYRWKQAGKKAEERKQNRRFSRISAQCWTEVKARLEKKHSPQQISGRLKREGKYAVSHERIYQYVYQDKAEGGQLYQHLACQKKRRIRSGAGRDRRGQIKDRVSIDERPAVVDEVSRVGDWEADTVVGAAHKGVFVTLHERSTATYLARKVSHNRADLVAAAIIDALEPYRDYVHTITADNGREFAAHKVVAKAMNCDFYFAHPYRSCERGRNENSNGRLRRFFPKGISLHNVTQKQLDQAIETMLDTPRKLLDYKTPREDFYQRTRFFVKNYKEVALST